MKKYILAVLGSGPGETLEETDLWGIISLLSAFAYEAEGEDNRMWAEKMRDRLMRLCDAPEGEVEELEGL